MPSHAASTFEVRLDDPLTRSRIHHETLPEPGSSDIVLQVERFGLTSNNLTYALLGNETPTRYWDVFPAESGWGRVPAWGSARVIDGDESVARTGERFVGLLPMADRFVFSGHRTEDGLLTSSAPRRSAMPSTYRDMRGVPDGDGAESASSVNVLLQPFYSFAALLAGDVADGGAETAVISSASSKAGLLVGRLLLRRGIRAIGLTASSRRDATESTGAFTEVRSYSDVSELAVDGPTAFVDIAGDSEVSTAVAQRLADDLSRIIIVGATHHDAAAAAPSAGESEDPTAPEVEMFDTAESEATYVEEHGAAALRALEDDARDDLLPWASERIHVEEVVGIAALDEAWRAVQQPPTSLLQGTVITASPRR